MVIIVILSILFLAFLTLFIYNKKAYFKFKNIKSEELGEYLSCLLYRGENGSFAIIQKEKHKPFLQLKKKVIKKGNVKLIFEFPRANWSRTYYEELKILLDEEMVNHEIKQSSDESSLEFIRIDCESKVDFCVAMIHKIFLNIFKINNDAKYKIKYSSISPHDEKIGF